MVLFCLLSQQTANALLGVLIHSGWFNSSRHVDGANLYTGNINLAAFLQGELSQSQTSQCRPDLGMTQVFAVGGVLLRHVQQLVCNAHAITAVHTTQVSAQYAVETQSQVRVATAIYPTASLMNHSCDPTIICRCVYFCRYRSCCTCVFLLLCRFFFMAVL